MSDASNDSESLSISKLFCNYSNKVEMYNNYIIIADLFFALTPC